MGGSDRKRHTERISKRCLNCAVIFTVPVCRDGREHCCSSKCKHEYRTKKVNERRDGRKSNCHVCGAVFYPRNFQIKVGQGKYCSHKCFYKVIVSSWTTPQAVAKRVKSKKLAAEEGRFVYKTGASNHAWKGGKEASAKRRRESRKNQIYTRMWRKNNPDKVREQKGRRKGKCLGRLPRGTIVKLRELQKNRCAICSVVLPISYHVDHIIPLFLGGKHEPFNVQLTCGPCNVRKSAKDPIFYMQECGYLL